MLTPKTIGESETNRDNDDGDGLFEFEEEYTQDRLLKSNAIFKESTPILHLWYMRLYVMMQVRWQFGLLKEKWDYRQVSWRRRIPKALLVVSVNAQEGARDELWLTWNKRDLWISYLVQLLKFCFGQKTSEDKVCSTSLGATIKTGGAKKKRS
ncbi:Protein of unknown function [Gryllus bimaculatus]|nr:Protein of unknown function [Gryllus bimaculatus]